MKNIAIILASGRGSRSGLDEPKQFFVVGGKTLLEHTLETFNHHKQIDGIIVVGNPEYMEKTQAISKGFEKVIKVIAGGKTRQESSYEGVFAVDEAENILIHDAVRAFITENIISDCIKGLQTSKAVCTAIETSDTILEVNEEEEIISVPERKFLRCAQTPQCFKYDLIKHAHEIAKIQGQEVTDDCGLILRNNLAKINVVRGESNNRKITYPEDLEYAEWIYEKRA